MKTTPFPGRARRAPRRCLHILIPLALAAAHAARAETGAPGAEVGTLDTVIVTGTRARDRTELNSTTPVDILSAEDLRAAAGAEGNLGDALQALLPSFNYLDQSNSGSADHVRAAQLRGLDPSQTLVLINGKRVHTTSIVNVESVEGLGSVAVDFASIPVNAVKRVEVLRDGAGAQYGSDAVAGVINVILDDARSGGEIAVTSGLYHTHFAPTDRTLDDGQTTTVQGKYGVALPGDGFVRAGVDATHHAATNRAGFDQFYPNAPFTTFNPNSTSETFRVGDARITNLNLWMNGETAAGAARAYLAVLFNHRLSSGDAYFREPLDGTNNYQGIYPNGFLPRSTGTNQDLHASGGLRGPLAGSWDYDLSLTYGRNAFSYGLANSLNASYGAASPTNFNLGGFRFDQTTANLDLRGDLGVPGLSTPATLAWGAEARRESYATSPGDPASYSTGSQNAGGAGGAQGDGGLNALDVSGRSREAYGTYGDISAQLLPSVFADAGVRFDHYSDAGSATTGKLSARWEFLPRWALRASASDNFRAPALAQIASAYSPSSYVSLGQVGGILVVPPGSAAAEALGAQPLKPERSKNFSLGITARPIDSLQFSADIFKIEIDDRIALSQNIGPISGTLPAGSPLVAGATYQFLANAADTNTQGAEVVGSWSHALAAGTVRVSDASSWADTSIRGLRPQPAATTAYTVDSNLLFGYQAQNALTTAIPRHRDVVAASWSNETWNVLARATYSGQVTRVFDFGPSNGGIVAQTYDATVQLDLEGEYHATRDLALALGVRNLTDRYPTMSNASINYGGNLPYDFLSPIGFNGRYVYARLRLALH